MTAPRPTLSPRLSTSAERAARCLDNLAIDTGAKPELIERIVAAMDDARREAFEEAAKVSIHRREAAMTSDVDPVSDYQQNERAINAECDALAGEVGWCAYPTCSCERLPETIIHRRREQETY